ncbi:hypothetical protein BH11BAC2_BH11BAC2_15720 [soil metagenome]
MKLFVNTGTLCLSLITLSVLISGCAPKIYTPSSENTSSGKNVIELKKGYDLYTTKCGRCHKLVSPSRYNATQWTYHVNKMQPKAKITDSEKTLIYNYLTNEPVKKGTI